MLEEINKRHIVIVDPEIGKRKISVNENLQDYFEAIVILKKTSEFVEKKHYINNVTLAIKQNMGSLKKLWGSIILSFAIEVCSLILPICTQIIIDVAIGRGNYDIILLVFLLGIGAVLLYGVLSYLKSNIILSMSYDFWKNFSEDIIKKLFHLPISYFDIRSSGDISNRINNINLIKDTMARIGTKRIISTFISEELPFMYSRIVETILSSKPGYKVIAGILENFGEKVCTDLLKKIDLFSGHDNDKLTMLIKANKSKRLVDFDFALLQFIPYFHVSNLLSKQEEQIIMNSAYELKEAPIRKILLLHLDELKDVLIKTNGAQPGDTQIISVIEEQIKELYHQISIFEL